MSVQNALSGFMAQTTIALLDAFRKDDPWLTLQLEPPTVVDENGMLISGKIDIEWAGKDYTRKVQVKSSINEISYAMANGYAKEMVEANRLNNAILELALIAPHSSDVRLANAILCDRVNVRQLFESPRHVDTLLIRGRDTLTRFLYKYEITIDPDGVQNIFQLLRDDLQTNSVLSKTWGRDEFFDRFFSQVHKYKDNKPSVALIGSPEGAGDLLDVANGSILRSVLGYKTLPTYLETDFEKQKRHIDMASCVVFINCEKYDENAIELLKIAKHRNKSTLILTPSERYPIAPIKSDRASVIHPKDSNIAREKKLRFDKLFHSWQWVQDNFNTIITFDNEEELKSGMLLKLIGGAS